MQNTYKVVITETKVLVLHVPAETAEEAIRKVEASVDADADFGHDLIDGSWTIDSVEEINEHS